MKKRIRTRRAAAIGKAAGWKGLYQINIVKKWMAYVGPSNWTRTSYNEEYFQCLERFLRK